MKFKLLFPWLCVAGLLVGLGALFLSQQKQSAELETLRADSQELQQLRLASEEAKKKPTENDELLRLRKENEDVLRLRNEVRQLRTEKQQLTKQAETAQAQAQRAQAQAQAQTARVNTAPADPAMTPEQSAVFRARYGLAASTPEEAKMDTCINNLRQIDAAKQQWALENKKTVDAVPSAVEIAPYLKNGVPACPVGGSYTLNAVNAKPACSIPGHAIPK